MYCINLIYLRGKLEREYAEVKERIFSKYPEKFPAEKFTVELFLWAFVMLVSTVEYSTVQDNLVSCAF